MTSLTRLIGRFEGKRVLVVGDMILDEYIVGRPARISREAPVLVLHHSEQFACPGGAANVAYNLVTLGAKVQVAGVIGEDLVGEQFRQTLTGLGIDTAGLVIHGGRATATKTRVVGRGDQEIQQQIVRVDRVDTSALDATAAAELLTFVRDALPSIDALLISDYENGVISAEVLNEALPAARNRNLVVSVDSHGDLYRFKGITVATPNQPEAEATLGRPIASTEDLELAGEELRRGMDAQGILITRGSQGMSLFERDHPPRHLAPTNVREVFDPTGAGDTACAVSTLALLAGGSMFEAAQLSNVAAGEVVKKLGAATLTAADLERAADRTPGL